MNGMKIYSENKENILRSQFNDPLLKYLTNLILNETTKHVKRRGRILDIGCGVGRTSIKLAQAGYEVVGEDTNRKVVNIAKRYIIENYPDLRVRFITADKFNAHLKNIKSSYDGIICSEVIEHVDKYDILLKNLISLLKKDGYLILTTPNDPSQWSVLDEYAGHLRRFSPDQIINICKALNIKVVDLYSIGYPFFRILIRLYNNFIRLTGRTHSFNDYNQSTIYGFVYIPIVTILLRADRLFRTTKRGTTIILIAQK